MIWFGKKNTTAAEAAVVAVAAAAALAEQTDVYDSLPKSVAMVSGCGLNVQLTGGRMRWRRRREKSRRAGIEHGSFIGQRVFPSPFCFSSFSKFSNEKQANATTRKINQTNQ